jgi:CheY-like chemotaxis protein
MKRDERTQHLPVIMLSMVDVPAEIERCDALGCNVSMTKPVEETRVIKALRQWGFFNCAATDRAHACDTTRNAIMRGSAACIALITCSEVLQTT